jgi:hypothetical protein
MNPSPPQKRKAAPAGDGLAFKKAATSWQTRSHGASGTSLCDQIKERVNLRDVAAMCGIELPRDGVKFCSPFRPDRNPSCTIKDDVMRDWSRNESFDAIALYAAAQGITNSDAVRSLGEKLNLLSSQRGAGAVASTRRCGTAPVVFDGHAPSDADYQGIIQTRKLPPESISGLLIARGVGVLHFADVGGFRCWLVADESKRCAEARRIDGKTFPAIGNLAERKAHTIKGSTKSWPVGLALGVGESRAKHLRAIPLVLVEGGPDLMAAFALLAALPTSECDVQPAAMLGTSASIDAGALEQIAGRRVLVLAHGDKAGADAAARWGRQLSEANCKVQLRHLPDGQDLNDLVSKHGLETAVGVLR